MSRQEDCSQEKNPRAIAFLAWLVPLFVSFAALYVAWQTNDHSARQASAIIRPFAYPIANAATGGKEALCETTLMLSNVGGIGTAVLQVRTQVYVGGRNPISSYRPMYGWSEDLNYNTAIGIGSSLMTTLDIDNFPTTGFVDLPIGIGPGDTIELVVDTLLESKSDQLRLLGSSMEVLRGVDDTKMPNSEWVSVEYVIITPEQSTVTLGLIPCSRFET